VLRGRWQPAVLTGILCGIVYALFLTRIRRAHFPWDANLLAVFGLPLFSYLVLRSWIRHHGGTVIWKDRTYGARSESAVEFAAATIGLPAMNLPAGTQAYIGAPARPMNRVLSRTIGTALGKIPEIKEAHLPQVYIKGKIDPPAQILVVVIEEGAPSQLLKIKEAMRG